MRAIRDERIRLIPKVTPAPERDGEDGEERRERTLEQAALRAEQRALLAETLRGPLYRCLMDSLTEKRSVLLRQIAVDIRMDPQEWRFVQGRVAEMEAIMRDPVSYLLPPGRGREVYTGGPEERT